jgi:uncharacterized cofD-like protein
MGAERLASETVEGDAGPLGWARPDRTNVLRPTALLECPRRVVCFGGGTGMPVVLRGLSGWASIPNGRRRSVDLTAVVAMSDDGGSSGRLRRTRGLLPPGDIRNCLVALTRRPSFLAELFQYRFDGTRGLAGHSVGNLLIAALTEQRGDFLEAVRLSSQLLGVRGRVLPSTLAPVQLVAEVDGSERLIGEHVLAQRRGRVHRVTLMPRHPPPVDGLIQAIAHAHLIVLGPGSLYSSILPNLLVAGVAEALQRSSALKVLVGNLMTQPGETEGMSGEDHVAAVLEHAGKVVDVVLTNAATPPEALLRRYAERGSHRVQIERERLRERGVAVVETDLLKVGPRIRHDRRKLARALLRLAREA